MIRIRSKLQSIRSFSNLSGLHYPLQPAKQRKTTPFRHPKRPLLTDPLETDPSVQRFKLSDHPNSILVIREPNSMPNLTDNLLPFNQSKSASNDFNLTLTNPILTNPIPSNQSILPPPLKQSKQFSNSLTPEILKQIQNERLNLSLNQLSKKYQISKLIISMLGFKNELDRSKIQLKDQMRQQRKENKWSIGKLIRRQEKRLRRSLW
ncbi:hypothetical protein O181_059494 [Austropuccinia psidii MF-1]|uniref:Uncharacterized protein n=1 Tax=Austropuccinia psidii MF-1 TaxID=1389203 RepID=A0A9Q3EED8_9BASI|nr:hypothetical protein [Austropuccinia psidii MF-1]